MGTIKEMNQEIDRLCAEIKTVSTVDEKKAISVRIKELKEQVKELKEQVKDIKDGEKKQDIIEESRNCWWVEKRIKGKMQITEYHEDGIDIILGEK